MIQLRHSKSLILLLTRPSICTAYSPPMTSQETTRFNKKGSSHSLSPTATGTNLSRQTGGGHIAVGELQDIALPTKAHLHTGIPGTYKLGCNRIPRRQHRPAVQLCTATSATSHEPTNVETRPYLTKAHLCVHWLLASQWPLGRQFVRSHEPRLRPGHHTRLGRHPVAELFPEQDIGTILRAHDNCRAPRALVRY